MDWSGLTGAVSPASKSGDLLAELQNYVEALEGTVAQQRRELGQLRDDKRRADEVRMR